MTPFNYARAGDTDEALRLAGGQAAAYLGGGTNLVDLMRETIARPDRLIDVTGLSETIEETETGGLLIGAAVRNTALAEHRAVRTRYPVLTRAIMAGASAQIRNMATVGGNLLQRTRCTYFYDTDGSRCNKRVPGSGCDAIDGFNRIHAILGASSACVATHPSDMCVALAALDATVHVAGTGGARTLPFDELHRLPGEHPEIDTVLESGEPITAVELPPMPFAAKSTYRKVRDRASYAFALVSVAAALDLEGGRVKDVRIALGGVAHKPWRAAKAEALLRDGPATEQAFMDAAIAELSDARPLSDNGFKIELAKRTLVAVLSELRGELAQSSSMNIVENAKAAAQAAMQGVMGKLVPLAPDSWIPGGVPDPLIARKHGTIGTPVSRLDGQLKVQGAARFAAEFVLDDMVYAALAYATIPRGRIETLDTEAAEAAPGVVLVMTYRNAPRMKPPGVFGSSPTAVGPSDLPILQDDRIHWNGQPIAAVLAETQEQADHAKSLIRVTYEAEPSTTSLAKAKAAGAKPGLFMGQPLLNEIGDAEAELKRAVRRIDHVYRTPRHNHNAIEPHGATIAWVGEELIIHDMSQMVTATAATIADVFDLKPDQVRITSPYVGGGFGSKGLWDHQIIGAAAAKLARRPVRINLSREGVYRVVGGRTLTEQRVAIGATADGHITALIHTGTAVMSPHNNMPEPFIMGTRAAYAADSFKLSVETVTMNMLANTFMRAPGESVGTFGLESAVDELAVELGMDPVDLRIRNEPEKDPTSGLPFSSRHIVEAWRTGAERFGWSDRSAVPGARREGEWLTGMGCATGTYPYYRMPGAAARITLTANGTGSIAAMVEVAAHEMGMGTSTTTTMVAAERLGLPIDAVEVRYGDSIIPGAIMAGGSQQTAAIGAAVIAAHRALVAELLKLAGNDSPLAGLSPDEVGSEEGGLAKLDDPTRRETYTSILARAQRDSVMATEEASQPLELMHWSMHSHSALFCEVRVNAVTAETRISRFLGSFDCGRILNPKTARSQFRGSIIMGLGMALMEETQFDERNGRIMNPSLAEYHVPVHLDVPDIDVIWTDIADPHTPMGAHGIGEIGITGVAAAVANAIYNATGKRVRDLPITLDKLL